ncbi:MAG TPA: hypothetical protein P5049_04870, partial [Methanothrix sp.]|nr:hypothetical protein [Methanothrix sp.]
VYERDRRLAGGGVLRTLSGILISWNLWASAASAAGRASFLRAIFAGGSYALDASTPAQGPAANAVAAGDPETYPKGPSQATFEAAEIWNLSSRKNTHSFSKAALIGNILGPWPFSRRLW